jgi:biopolymer transport protein ExbD
LKSTPQQADVAATSERIMRPRRRAYRDLKEHAMEFRLLQHPTTAAKPLAEINMVPLIDVMLVLLVIFIVTAPLLTHAVKVDLPKADQKLRVAAALSPQPELHLRAERTTPYEKVAEVMSAAAREGLTRIGFVTEPTRNAAR